MTATIQLRKVNGGDLQLKIGNVVFKKIEIVPKGRKRKPRSR